MKKGCRTKTVPKILAYLAQNKPYSKWNLANMLGKSYGNTHATIQRLLKSNLIKVERKRPSTRNPKIEVEYYGLTFPGLFAALIDEKIGDEMWENIDGMARNYADEFPEIFGKWDFFIEKGVRDTIVERLRVAIVAANETTKITDFSMQLAKKSAQRMGRTIEWPSDKKVLWTQIRRRITNSVLGLNMSLPPKDEIKQLIQILREDPELKRYLNNEAKVLTKFYKGFFENIRGLEQWLKSLEP